MLSALPLVPSLTICDVSDLPELLIESDRARELLAARVHAGETLLQEILGAQAAFVQDLYSKVERAFNKWDRYNEILIRTLFSGDEILTNYDRSKPIYMTRDLRTRFEALKSRLEGAIGELEATVDTIDLLPRVSVTLPRASTDTHRDAYFEELCRVTGGRTDVVCQSKDIGGAVGLDDHLRSDVEDFLVAEGLIEFVTMGPTVRLTHVGRMRCEKGLSASSTTVAQGGQTIVIHGDVTGSTIQQASHGSSPSANTWNVYEAARTWIDELDERLADPQLAVSDELRDEALGLIAQTRQELDEPEPDKRLLRLTFRALQSVMSDAGGSLVAAGLLAGLPELLRALGA